MMSGPVTTVYLDDGSVEILSGGGGAMVRRKMVSTANIVTTVGTLSPGAWFEWSGDRCFYVGPAGNKGMHVIQKKNREGKVEFTEASHGCKVEEMTTCTGWDWNKEDDTRERFWLVERDGLWNVVWGSNIDMLTLNAQKGGGIVYKELPLDGLRGLLAPAEGEE